MAIYTQWEIYSADEDGIPVFRDTTIADEKSDAIAYAKSKFGNDVLVIPVGDRAAFVCHWCGADIDSAVIAGETLWSDKNGGRNCLWADKRTGKLSRLIDPNGKWLIHEPSEVVWERDESND